MSQPVRTGDGAASNGADLQDVPAGCSPLAPRCMPTLFDRLLPRRRQHHRKRASSHHRRQSASGSSIDSAPAPAPASVATPGLLLHPRGSLISLNASDPSSSSSGSAPASSSSSSSASSNSTATVVARGRDPLLLRSRRPGSVVTRERPMSWSTIASGPVASPPDTAFPTPVMAAAATAAVPPLAPIPPHLAGIVAPDITVSPTTLDRSHGASTLLRRTHSTSSLPRGGTNGSAVVLNSTAHAAASAVPTVLPAPARTPFEIRRLRRPRFERIYADDHADVDALVERMRLLWAGYTSQVLQLHYQRSPRTLVVALYSTLITRHACADGVPPAFTPASPSAAHDAGSGSAADHRVEPLARNNSDGDYTDTSAPVSPHPRSSYGAASSLAQSVAASRLSTFMRLSEVPAALLEPPRTPVPSPTALGTVSSLRRTASTSSLASPRDVESAAADAHALKSAQYLLTHHLAGACYRLFAKLEHLHCLPLLRRLLARPRDAIPVLLVTCPAEVEAVQEQMQGAATRRLRRPRSTASLASVASSHRSWESLGDFDDGEDDVDDAAELLIGTPWESQFDELFECGTDHHPVPDALLPSWLADPKATPEDRLAALLRREFASTTIDLLRILHQAHLLVPRAQHLWDLVVRSTRLFAYIMSADPLLRWTWAGFEAPAVGGHMETVSERTDDAAAADAVLFSVAPGLVREDSLRADAPPEIVMRELVFAVPRSALPSVVAASPNVGAVYGGRLSLFDDADGDAEQTLVTAAPNKRASVSIDCPSSSSSSGSASPSSSTGGSSSSSSTSSSGLLSSGSGSSMSPISLTLGAVAARVSPVVRPGAVPPHLAEDADAATDMHTSSTQRKARRQRHSWTPGMLERALAGKYSPAAAPPLPPMPAGLPVSPPASSIGKPVARRRGSVGRIPPAPPLHLGSLPSFPSSSSPSLITSLPPLPAPPRFLLHPSAASLSPVAAPPTTSPTGSLTSGASSSSRRRRSTITSPHAPAPPRRASSTLMLLEAVTHAADVALAHTPPTWYSEITAAAAAAADQHDGRRSASPKPASVSAGNSPVNLPSPLANDGVAAQLRSWLTATEAMALRHDREAAAEAAAAAEGVVGVTFADESDEEEEEESSDDDEGLVLTLRPRARNSVVFAE
ncbi:hypothetical protein H9P43_000610 [Blastocladiella emersonii ATCC 22665]|nr:hypothetical protein H9P43_000610 [Blastocladiella emersonii ATCC 22665]